MKHKRSYYLLCTILLLSGFVFFAKGSISRQLQHDTIDRLDTLRGGRSILQADPTIFYHEGYYYLYGTNGDQDERLGFKVYRSQDLQHWEGPVGVHGGFALIKDEVFGSTGFWAPQVWFENGKFFMAYTADEKIAIAVSDSPLGPFKQEQAQTIIKDGKEIDPFVFVDTNKKKYLFHVRLSDGNRIFVAQLKDDYSGIIAETLRECIHAELPWENTANAEWTVSEGPTVIRSGDRYYMFYSANDFRNKDYAVGVAVAEHIFGPWKKMAENPALDQKISGFAGTGHGDLFRKENQWYYVCHTHYSKDKVAPRRTAIVPVDFSLDSTIVSVPKFDGSKFRLLKAGKKTSNHIDVAFGDPFVVFDKKTDRYYLYGTGGTENGFIAYSSSDLKNWRKEGKVYDANQSKGWGIKDFWAPEVYYINDKYYLYYSAHWKDNPHHHLENYRIGVAVADNPLGPFIDLTGKPIFDPGYPIIDANVFRDSDNRNYLFYSRCCYEHPVASEIADWAKKNLGYEEVEESWVYGVELDSSMSKVIGEPILLIRPPVKMNDSQSEWESRSVSSGEINRRWTEGSFLIKEKGQYYMMYSANYFAGANYAVGYATAEKPLGKYQKSMKNPIIEKNTNKGGIVSGTGHNSIFRDREGKLRCVYHGRTTATGDDRMVFISDVIFQQNGELTVHTD
ncbi:glycoside hydrolase family 43 protein [Sphingobacterium sp. N143]|uniref:glycoside hydrolase family 43 protein n=1 Tax=Sphingobacterium sp. N143 TaxID=2746727 RepID=UPI0025755B8E|nr:glycoside hydrolase family 43 protein [Sphingobacterium sp. N143]